MKTIKLGRVLTAVIVGATLLSGQAMALPTWNFSYSRALDPWTAPTTGVYQITAIGAQGGHGTNGPTSFVGGRGAQVTGSFNIVAGSTFSLAVGGEGSSLADQFNGGGGGGSFVVDASGSPFLVAGGGGGIRSFASQNGFDASITPYGGKGVLTSSGAMVIKTTGLGLGGIVTAAGWGSGGAGFFGDGQDDGSLGNGGSSWANGLFGGSGSYSLTCDSFGGFGGGGSGTGCGGGGGGGGYSGGDSGWIAGGGGSWNMGFDQAAIAGVGFGDGRILIRQLSSIPEPGSLALAGLALAGLSILWRRRRPGEQKLLS